MITKVITKRNWESAKIAGEINEKSLIEEIYPLFIFRTSFKRCSKTFRS